jgi:hypothetical protein
MRETMHIQCQHPNAIWHQRNTHFAAYVCRVNHLYRYAILEQATGIKISAGYWDTLKEAKVSVLAQLTILEQETV